MLAFILEMIILPDPVTSCRLPLCRAGVSSSSADRGMIQ